MFPSISSALLWRGLLAIVIGVVSVAWPGDLGEALGPGAVGVAACELARTRLVL